MKVFITGASGFIGLEVVKKLVAAGHTVVGLARSEASARAIRAAGGDVLNGSLEDLESLKKGASASDGVIHLGFIHDFSKFAENCEIDRKAIMALGEALVGSKRPLVVTSGTGVGATGQMRTEEDPLAPIHPNLPRASEAASAALLEKGVNVMVVRLPQVHDTRKQGLVTMCIEIARQKGQSGYVGEGENRWPACPLDSAAELYKLVLEKGETGARYNAVAEEGVSAREIAEALGKGLKVPVKSMTPEEAAEHFGFFSHFISLDMPASSQLTQARLNWKPVGPGLIEDLHNMKMLEAATR